MHYVYILQSQRTGRYYIGSTNNIERRLYQHNHGRSKSTKYGRPWKLVYSETHVHRSAAFGREQQIKRYKSGNGLKAIIFGEVA